MLERIHILICVFVSLVVTVTGIIMNLSLYELGIRLIISIISFYILGVVIREYLKRRVFAVIPEEGENGPADDEDQLKEDTEAI